MEWMIIVILWMVFPVVGTIAIVVLGIMNARYKKQIKELLEQREKWQLWQRQYEAGMMERELAAEMPEKAAEEKPEKAPTEVRTDAEPEKKAFCHPVPLPEIRPDSQTDSRPDSRPDIRIDTRHEGRETSGNFDRPRRIKDPENPPKHEKIQVPPGLAALVIGVIFVVIAGLIFATTNWEILPDLYKVVMVFAFAVFFFITSRVAEKRMKIERTSRAFYILGSIFLFLTVLAAGYFGLLGPGFVLDGPGRWWVLWAGSVVTEIAFIAGFRTYEERAFTFVYLGGLTVSVTFLMAALRGCGVGFANGMVCYAVVLLAVGRLDERLAKQSGNGVLPVNASVVWSTFAAVNFAVFGGLMVPGVMFGLMAAYGKWWQEVYRITPWSIFCMGLATAGTALLAAGQKEQKEYKVFYRIAVAVFLQYAVMGMTEKMPPAMEYRHLLAAALSGGWFVLGRKKRHWLWTEAGDGVITAAAAMNTLFLFFYAWKEGTDIARQLTASAAILILAGMVVLWSRQYQVLRRGVLYLLGALTVTGYHICVSAGIQGLRYDHVLFGYLVLVAVWDLVKKDYFWMDILVIGAIPQLAALLLEVRTSPFFLFLSVYLFIRTWGKEGKRERTIFCLSCLCSLAGTYMELSWRLPDRVLAMFAVTALMAGEYFLCIRRSAGWKKDQFWYLTGSVVFVALMVEYYADGGLAIGYLAGCLGLFYLIYGWIYLQGGLFEHLPMAAAMLPLPWHLAAVYDVTDGQILGGTAMVILASGIFFRLLGPVHESAGDGEETQRIDWIHILIGPVLVILAGAGDRNWESVYTLLLILYVLQFAMIAGLRKWAVTIAMALGVWLWWRQPFIRIPDIIWLEMHLLPVAVWAAALPKIWGQTDTAKGLRTGIHVTCLVLLTLAALFTEDVRDALMLEGICLLVFLAASRAGSRFWKNASGGILVLVTLYMTKAFWLSLSWWVYLLAAGIGLIVFAAWNEMKRR